MNWLMIGSFFKSLLSSKWFWVSIVAIGLASYAAVWHNNTIEQAIKETNDNRDKLELIAKAEAEDKAKIKSDQNAADIAAAANKSFIQGQQDAKTISDLRTAVNNGTLRLRQHQANCSFSSANTIPSAAERDATDRTDTARIVEDSQRVIRITEIGLDALKNWEEAQGIITADRAALKQEDTK
jgi:hypothetical protein